MHKYAGMRFYLNFSKSFIVNIFPAHKCNFLEDQGTCFADKYIKNKALDKVGDKANDNINDNANDNANQGTCFADGKANDIKRII